MLRWLRAFAQTTTYLGAVMIAVLWSGTVFLVQQERERAYRDGVRQGSNLTRVFAEYIARVVKGIDSTLLVLRELYERDPKNFDLARWVEDGRFKNDLVIQYSIIAPDGIIRVSSLQPDLPSIDVSDRDFFRHHRDAATDALHISIPVIGRVSGRQTVQLTRRIRSPDGAFAGIMLASLDILGLDQFYRSIDIGSQGVISLIGFDGILRARSGRDPAASKLIGHSVVNRNIFDLYRHSPSGHYWNFQTPRPLLDGVRRLISYRVVEGLPLLAVVGLAEGDIFDAAQRVARQYYQVALILSVIIVVAMGFGAARKMKLDHANAALERANLSLRQTNMRFNMALDNMTHGLSMFDAEHRLVVCNRRYAEIFRLPPELLKVGTPFPEIMRYHVTSGLLKIGNSVEAIDAKLRQLSRLPIDRVVSLIEEFADGRSIRITRQPMEEGGWLSTHEDITEQKQAEARIIHLARHDALTGLANRAVLLENMEEALARLRHNGEPFVLFILDLDLFKVVNDSLGHPIGDELLKAVAQRLLSCAYETDAVARLGGDEFAILAMLRKNPREEAIVMANKLLEAVAAPYDLFGHQVDIATTIGIALAPEHGVDVEQLMKNADLALYRAKAAGRNAYRFYEDEMGIEAQARRALEIDMRHGLMQDEFELNYHPIVDVRTRRAVGVEALVRWRHPQRGLISPHDFIPLAEETGLINQLGELVLQQACADAARWPPHVKVAVNLSPVQFRRGNLLNLVSQALAASGLPPERLELEITESVLMRDSEENVAILHQLRSLGVAIVLDDFGTGYASLSYLRLFPFDKIKIDRSFVAELSSNVECAAIVSATAGLGKSLRVDVVAEGVESEDQLLLVRAVGCTHAQGYLFGRPCAASELDFPRAQETEAAA